MGPQLYGTATENSDTDYKGVYLPTEKEILLNRVPKSYNYKTGNGVTKNTKDDIDIEIFSLHYFIKLACEGQTVALDMLHAPEDMIIEKSPLWDYIVANRHKFYTKNLQIFIGYARSQASKYGIRAGRLGNIRQVINFLEDFIEK
jgi:predicted nucleotidyltransferase